MTVQSWIDTYKDMYPRKIIRIIDSTTGKGTGCHWITYKDWTYKKIKITSKWIFIFI